jgi:hypothetical protein
MEHGFSGSGRWFFKDRLDIFQLKHGITILVLVFRRGVGVEKK